MWRKGWSLVEFLYEFDDDVDGSGDDDMDISCTRAEINQTLSYILWTFRMCSTQHDIVC